MSRIECGADEGSAQRELLRAPRDAGCAGRAPGDVLASVFELLNVRDRGSCRLVCRSWREFCDSTVHRLVLRCPLHTPLLGRFPLLHSCSLGSAVTSDGRAFATSISLLSALSLLVRLHLSFPCPAAVRLPSALHGLTRLTSLAVSISGDASAWAGATSSTTSSSSSNSSALAGPGRAARPSAELPPGIGHRGSVASSNSGASSNSSSTHRLSAVLCGLVAALPRLSTLELLNCPVSAGQLLAAAATAANAPPSACASPPGSGPVGGPSGASCSAVGPCQRSGCRGAGGGDSGGCCGLRVLVLVGSCVDLTGLASGAARRQLAGLEALHLDGCTGADSLVPLLPGLTRLQVRRGRGGGPSPGALVVWGLGLLQQRNSQVAAHHRAYVLSGPTGRPRRPTVPILPGPSAALAIRPSPISSPLTHAPRRPPSTCRCPAWTTPGPPPPATTGRWGPPTAPWTCSTCCGRRRGSGGGGRGGSTGRRVEGLELERTEWGLGSSGSMVWAAGWALRSQHLERGWGRGRGRGLGAAGRPEAMTRWRCWGRGGRWCSCGPSRGSRRSIYR